MTEGIKLELSDHVEGDVEKWMESCQPSPIPFFSHSPYKFLEF